MFQEVDYAEYYDFQSLSDDADVGDLQHHGDRTLVVHSGHRAGRDCFAGPVTVGLGWTNHSSAIAITAIASFCSPSYNQTISARLIRFVLLLLAAVLGAFGFFDGLIALVVRLDAGR